MGSCHSSNTSFADQSKIHLVHPATRVKMQKKQFMPMPESNIYYIPVKNVSHHKCNTENCRVKLNVIKIETKGVSITPKDNPQGLIITVWKPCFLATLPTWKDITKLTHLVKFLESIKNGIKHFF